MKPSGSRTFGLLAAAMVVLVGLFPTTSSPAGVPKCKGKPATIVRGNADNEVTGTNGNDVIVTRGGNDVVFGRGGNDRICTGSDEDAADGGDGKDKLSGGSAVDQCIGGRSFDTFSSCETGPSCFGEVST